MYLHVGVYDIGNYDAYEKYKKNNSEKRLLSPLHTHHLRVN